MKNGPETKLTAEDNTKLVAFPIDTSWQGYGKGKDIIMFIGTQIAVQCSKKVPEGGLSHYGFAPHETRRSNMQISFQKKRTGHA